MNIIDPFQGFNAGLANLAQSARQAGLDSQQKRLADLQFQQLQGDVDYKQGLKSAMSNPVGVSQTTVTPEQPKLSLGMLAGQLQQPQFQPAGAQPSPLVQAYKDGRVQTETTKQLPARAGADYALSQGRIEDAVKLFTVDDQLAQMQAKGDLPGYYEAKQELEMNKQFFETIKKSAAVPGGLKQVWPQLQRMFPDQTAGITPESIQTNGRLVLAPLEMDGQIIPNRGVYYDEDGKQHIVDTTPKEQPSQYKDRTRPEGTGTVFETSDDGGKTWKVISRGKKGESGSGGGVPEADEVTAWADAVSTGRANLSDIPARGSIRTKVIKMIEGRGGADYAGAKAENSAYSSSLAQQQKQVGSMGSFVKNLSAQIDRVGQIGAELNTFDSRILNVPLRAARARIAGSPLQAKYDMYLAEIESEIGKLSTGSTGSVAELSQGAQERWAKIHDKNLSIKDMLQLLKETKHAGELRMKSVKDQIDETRAERKGKVGGNKGSGKKDPLGIL